jgi:hypothetical protein
MATAVLVALHGVMLVARYGFGNPGFLKLQAFFDLNKEQNIPTLFSTLQLMAASFLLWVVFACARRANDRDRYYWPGLALIFAFLGGDEFCEWHERMIAPLQHAFHPTGALKFAWYIPYSLLILLFVVGYLRFWWRLPQATRRLFAFAGVLYVTGGIFFEMLGSKIFTVYGWDSVQFELEVMVEEGLEMTGVAVFVYAILCYLRDREGTFEVQLAEPASAAND